MKHDLSTLLDVHLLKKELGKRSLKQFTKDVWHIVEPGTPFVDGWCIDALCEHLEALTFGDLRKLVINIPPRHSKSTIVSVVWPVWDWLHIPKDRFLCASYKLSLAMRDNRRRRNLIEDTWFQDRYSDIFTLAGDQKMKSLFENDKKGYQMALSVAGSATGDGGSKLVIDDAHSADEAYSTAIRETAVTWFREVWSNRLNDANKDCMVVVGQRVHENDVCGYILRNRPDWEHLCLPAEYESHRKCITSIGWEDPRTKDGELLWPERFNTETLKGLKRDLGSTGFAAQYQQVPVDSSGGFFKHAWLRYFTEDTGYYILKNADGTEKKRVLKSSCIKFITGDLAISEKQDADYTVFIVWLLTKDKELLLLEITRGHFDNPEQQDIIWALHQRHKPSYFKIESVAYQLALIQQMRKRGVPIREYNPTRKGDKQTRAITAAVMYESEQIYHLEGAEYLTDYEPELLVFPKGKNDDQIDNTSMAAEEATSGSDGGSFYVLSDDPEDYDYDDE